MSLEDSGMGNVSSRDQGWSIPGALSTAQSGLGAANAAYGAYRGIQSGTPTGYATAAIDAGKLAGKAGLLGNSNSAMNQGVGDAANALGIYQGIKQGGVSGDASAAINAAQLGSRLGAFGGASGAIGQGAAYAAIPLDLYNEVNSWESGNTGSDALSGAETGAAIGSVIPGIGTAVGALVGAAAGALSSAFGPGREDPESYGWGVLSNGYTNAGKQPNGQQLQQDIASSVQNPYEALAGMFDLHPGQVDHGDTLYAQYGRMGEQNFTHDLVNQLNTAKSNGTITPDMDASQIYSKVVQPWEDSWGKGQNTDANAGLMKALTTQMISQYEGGQAANDWRDVNGGTPFSNIYQGAPSSWGPSAKTQAAPMAKTQAVDRFGVPMIGYAKGGRAKRKAALDRLRSKTHYDDGGDVSFDSPSGGDTLDYYDPIIPDTSPTYDYNAIQNLNDENNLDQANQQGLDNLSGIDYGSGTGSSSGLSSLLGSLAKSAAPYASLLPILNGILGKQGSSGSSLPSGQSSGPTGPFPVQASPRTANAIDPNTDWYTYGQHPETQFFSNNSIGPLMGKFTQQPSQGSLPTPAPVSNGTMQPMPVGNTEPRPILRAHGGALDHLEDGTPVNQDSRYVTGPGDGQSDDIDAKLSNGEYVMDAHTVSLLGNGSNEAGAKRLDELRANLRKSAAKPMSKGKQFMHAKPPEHYLKGGRRSK